MNHPAFTLSPWLQDHSEKKLVDDNVWWLIHIKYGVYLQLHNVSEKQYTVWDLMEVLGDFFSALPFEIVEHTDYMAAGRFVCIRSAWVPLKFTFENGYLVYVQAAFEDGMCVEETSD